LRPIEKGTNLYLGNRTIGLHLLKGLLGAAALFIFLSTINETPLIALPFLAAGLYLWKGCPMCWTLGLIETIAMTIHRRAERQFDRTAFESEDLKCVR